MVTAVRAAAVADQLDSVRSAWVTEYRRGYPMADRWATGLRQVSHSLETQERVFRMAEQLARRGVDRAAAFAALEAADRSMAVSTDPQTAAQSGDRAINRLVPLARDSVVICASADDGLVDLRSFGFEPIAFDGRDPAAYAWVLFELASRCQAERDARPSRCDCHPLSAPTAIGFGRL